MTRMVHSLAVIILVLKSSLIEVKVNIKMIIVQIIRAVVTVTTVTIHVKVVHTIVEAHTLVHVHKIIIVSVIMVTIHILTV